MNPWIPRLRVSWQRVMGDRHSLRGRIVTNSQILIMKSAVVGGLDMARTMVFARLLGAADYGLMALALMGISLLESLTTTGMDLVIIGDDRYREHLPAYWAIKVFRGVGLFVLSWGLASPLAAYYHHPELVWMIRVLALGFLIKGLAGFGNEICQRELLFGRLAKLEVMASAAVFLLGMAMVYVWRDVRVLVFNQLAAALGLCVVSHVLFPWKPTFRFDPAILCAVLTFGGSIVVINALNYYFTNWDVGVVGKLCGVDDLGYYVRAYFVATLPVMYIANVMAPIFMPTFRQLLHEPQRLRRAFVKMALAYAVGFGLLGLVLFAGAKLIILLVYGERWLPVVPVFRVLIFYGVLKGVSTVCPSILFLRNRPWRVSISAGAMALSLALLCIPMTRQWGLVGTAWAVVFSAGISSALSMVMAFRLTGQDAGSEPGISVPKTGAPV